MPKAKLDHAYCLTAGCAPGKKKTDHWDTHIPGFVLETRQGGGATYALRYTDEGGRQRQLKIGRADAISNEQARKAARRLRAEIELGGNPQAQKQERKAIPTYAELAEQHIAHNETYQKTPKNSERIIRGHLIPRWGKLRLTDITAQDVAQWLSDKRKGGLAPATVEKLRVTFNRSFELAAKWGIAGGQHNPIRAVPRPRFNNKKERFLTADEADRLFAACDASANKRLGAICRLLLLTGARKMELLKAKCEHVDLQQRAWHIPDTKTGKPRYVPLSQAAIDVINELPRWDKCEWLIPNPDTRKPYSQLKRPWDTAREKAKLPGLRIHDLRHSAASFMINAGANLYTVGKVLGHADYQSTMRYSHLADDTLFSAVEAGAARMMKGA